MTTALGRSHVRFRALLLGAVVAGAIPVAWLMLRGNAPEQQWTAIETAIAERRWTLAESQLRPWLRLHPDDGKAWLRLGGVLAFAGRDADSVDAFQHVGASDPAWPVARTLIGENALAHHDLPAAEQAFRGVAEHSPAAVDPRRRLVYLLTLTQRQDEARAILWDLYRLTGDPRHLATIVGLATTEGDTRDMARELEVFFKQTPRDPWMGRGWGLMLMRVGRAAEARAYLEAAASVFEDDPLGRLALVEAQIALDDLDAAAATLDASAGRPSEAARWWLLQGDLAAARGRTDEAVAAWRKSIAIDPAERAPHYRVAQALVRQGRLDEARPLLERVEYLRVHGVRRISALDRFMRGERTAELTEMLATLCRETGLLAEAKCWFEETLRIDPDRSAARLALRTLVVPAAGAAPIPRLRPHPIAATETAAVAAQAQPTAPVRLIAFEETARRSGIDFQYNCAARGDMFLGDTMGGGVGLIDYDGDGWLDIYLVNGCALPYDRANPPRPNRLYRNEGGGRFVDVTQRAGVGGAGYGMGVAVGDYDNDGHDDLFVTGLGRTVLYRNRGDGTFEDVTTSAGVDSALWTTAAGFGDLDGDGDLDLVAVTYVAADPAHVPNCPDASGQPIHCPPGQFAPQPDLLFRNNGNGTFTDVSKEAGLDVPGGAGLGLAIADLDDDGRLDLFVANDAAPNFLFRNLGGLRFEEVGTTAGVAYDAGGRATASMGVVAEDLDRDGRIDLFHTNFINEGSTLLHNLGGGQFLDETARSGLGAPSRPVTGFGAVAFDADNDGLLDLFAANGHVDDRPWINHPMAQLPHFYRATSAGRFVLAIPPGSPYFGRPAVGRGAAAGDLDNDGRVDLVVVHRDQPVVLLRNTTVGGHWFGLRLVGGRSGKTPVGARITCQSGGQTAVRWFTTGTSYLAASDPRIWFGLGAALKIDRLEVRWPSGLTQSWHDLPADRIFMVAEGSAPTHEHLGEAP
jgi:tetratricopeptide (TPR) repeat protein